MFFQIKKNRVYGIWAIVSLLFILLFLRTGYVMLVWSKELNVITENQYTINEPISNINYLLLDRNGRELLDYTTKYYFVVDVDTFIKNNKDTDVSLIKTIIYTLRNYNKDYDLSVLKYGEARFRKTYVIDEATYNKLKTIEGVKGVYTFSRREVNKSNSWSYENLLASFQTMTNETKSKDSIEWQIQEATKRNEFPKLSFEKDILGEFKRLGYTVPDNNINIRLTTDKDIQEEIKEVLVQEKYKKYDQIGVVLMEASTGKVLAMVQRDDWKPNILLCSATDNGYEPGSIFKTIVQEAAIEKNGIPISKKYLCTEEKKQHGYIDMEEAFIVSCNTYFANLGNEIKFSNILELARAQGLFSKALNFHGNEEVTGDYVYPKKNEYQRSAINNGLIKKIKGNEEYNDIIGASLNVKHEEGTESMLAIGQSMRITPVQALSIVNTVVNSGKYVKPYIIDSYINDSNEVIKKFSYVSEPVIKSSTANILKNQMIKVVQSSKGTARQAFLGTIETGGKTGTNTRIEYTQAEANGQKSYIPEKHSDGWFTGFYKIKDKYYSMVVFVKDIDVQYDSAGSTAVPIFKEIVQKIQNYNK